jgi:hypothetical protein
MAERPQKRMRLIPKQVSVETAGELDPEAGQRPAFPGLDRFHSNVHDLGPPMDVGEYLNSVRTEAARRPTFVSIKNPAVSVGRRPRPTVVLSIGLNYDDSERKTDGASKESETLRLDRKWIDLVLQRYKNMRKDIGDATTNEVKRAQESNPGLPEVASKWRKLMFGGEITPDSPLVKSLTVEQTVRLLTHCRRWIGEVIPGSFSLWLIALLARMPDVLTADESSALRELAKKCVRIRSAGTKELDFVTQYTLDYVCAIVGVFYSQSDLIRVI